VTAPLPPLLPCLRGPGGDIGPLEEVAAQAVPVGRPGTPEEIAATCGFLCSEGASFITGQVVGVNGGMVV
jgi:NAD(P)-dependent dehydrogenase (short-subunit alcohol dehydrogenase family)